jgi:protoheme IX farnesyltransferase
VPVALSLLLTGSVGWIYGMSAAELGAGFVRETWLLRRSGEPSDAMSVFRFSITYLALLFCAVAADQLILG